MLLVAGCATRQLTPEPLAAAQQEALLLQLEFFAFSGRAAVAAQASGFNAGIDWQQRGDEAAVRLAAPIGGSLLVTWRPDQLRLEAGRGQVLQGSEAASVIQQELGFLPPFESLRYWVLGLAAPGAEPAVRSDAEDGRVAELLQQGWQIRYERWMNVPMPRGVLRMPQRLTATRDGLRLRLVVDRWKFAGA